jgi:putative transposase
MHWCDRSHRRRAINEPGHAHELTFTCFHNHAFLQAERTFLWLAEAIGEARAALDFALWAYVFMPDHVHLIVWPRQERYDISQIRKEIKEPVGRKAIAYLRQEAPQWLSQISVRRGRRTERHFWQSGGGFDRNVTEARTLMHMIEYIHNNPVRKGLVARPEDWKWSSAGWLIGQEPNSLRPDPIPPEWDIVEYPAARL